MFESEPPPEPITTPSESPDWNGVGGLHPNESEKIEGLGDVVHRIAQPIAKGIDRVLKTNIQECGGCEKRRESLNKKFPMGK